MEECLKIHTGDRPGHAGRWCPAFTAGSGNLMDKRNIRSNGVKNALPPTQQLCIQEMEWEEQTLRDELLKVNFILYNIIS
jgi:hypothetical protein